MQFGWSGVDLFFVLSGYLIAMNYESYSTTFDGYLQFIRNRLLRIAPLYFLVVIAFFVYILIPGTADKQHYYAPYVKSWYEYPLFIQNWGLILHKKPEANHLEHFWSLAVEMQFYLLSPVLIQLMRRLKTGAVLFLIPIGLIAVRYVLAQQMDHWNEYYVYYGNTFCRVDSFLMGIFLFLNKERLNRTSLFWIAGIGLALLVTVGWIDGDFSMHHSLMAGLGFTGFYLVYGFLVAYPFQPNESFLSPVLSHPILQFFGKYSYGLYVFHWIVLRMAGGGLQKLLQIHMPFEWATITASNILLLTTLALSMISYHWIETPFLRLKKK